MPRSSSRAAVWRDADGRALATEYGRSECRNPRFARDLAAASEDGGYETIMRCRNCEGCRKYDELYLRRRLAAHYKEVSDDLWIVRLEATLAEQSRLCARVRRVSDVDFEPGLYRDGDAGVAMVVRGDRPALSAIRGRGARAVRVEPIGRRRNPRAFRELARGLMAERGAYGPWTKRFYQRGLAALPRQNFLLEKRGGIRKRHPEAKAGVRAWRRGAWLDASEVTRGEPIMALLIRRDGDLNGRKCTHSKCPDDRCLLNYRAAAARLPVNPAPRASAASASLNDRISDCSAGGGLVVSGEGGARKRHSDEGPKNAPVGRSSSDVPSNGLKPAGAATFAPRPIPFTKGVGRDAGSLQSGGGFAAAWLERMTKIARSRAPDGGGGKANS